MRNALRIFLLLGCSIALAADPLPSKPARYVEDAAGLLNAQMRDAINAKLDAFERETSSQVLVAIFPKVPDGYAMEDFTQRTAEAWGVGQKATDNGVVFFIFPQDHKMRIEVGYGLEGAIPDATAKMIMDREVTPAFRSGDFAGGVTRGVDAILAAARGEYKGNGQTNADRDGTNTSHNRSGNSSDYSGAIGAILLTFFFISILVNMVRSTSWHYSGKGRKRRSSWSSWPPAGGGFSGGGNRWGGGGSSGGGFGGGGSSGGGGGFSGGGGGFSGGGGGFGGGGASGGW